MPGDLACLIRIPIRIILGLNRYDCELVRDGQKWRFKRITIDNAWVQGDPEISCHAEALRRRINALAGRQALRQTQTTEITPTRRLVGGTGDC
jgi:hypothetical protein